MVTHYAPHTITLQSLSLFFLFLGLPYTFVARKKHPAAPEMTDVLFRNMSALIKLLFSKGLLNPPGDLLDSIWGKLPVCAMVVASGFKMPSIISKLWSARPNLWTKASFVDWFYEGAQCKFPLIESHHLSMRGTGALVFYKDSVPDIVKVRCTFFLSYGLLLCSLRCQLFCTALRSAELRFP